VTAAARDDAPADVPGPDVLRADVLPADVAVRWLPAACSTVAALMAMGADAAGHACPRCGSDAHGMPWARAGEVRLAASASRTGAHLVVATRPASSGAIGIDVEASDADLDARVVLHRSEVGAALDLVAAWVAKEAIAKHLGTGLRTDPRDIRLADFDVRGIPAPHGLVAAVCLGPAPRIDAR
jgi:4'-phosphopantetheinyl transferase